MDAQRKPRRTTSENVDQDSPAFRVVEKAGGLTRFCELFDFATSTVHSWMAKRTASGANGLVPSRTRYVEELGRTVSYQSYIIWKGAQLDPPIEYTPEDFVDNRPVEALG